MITTNRRQFLGGVGGTLGATAVGLAAAQRLGFAEARAWIEPGRLRFGALDPLVDLLQATPADELLPRLVERLRAGTTLDELVAAGALANARALGGTDYNGYHALMALVPSLELARRMPGPLAPLPVLKVLHRSTRFIHDAGHAQADELLPLADDEANTGTGDLVASLRTRDLARAEQALAREGRASPARAHEELQTVVRDDADVHRVVLAWRAFDLARLTGPEHAVTLLRQSVHYCIEQDGQRAARGQAPKEIGALVAELIEAHGLAGHERGTRAADEAWIEALAGTVHAGESAAAARAVARALAEGYDPEDVGAALSLAANRLLLNDPGRSKAEAGKPVGSVHGASVGVHASDAANAWRNLARAGGARNAFASLIAGAYHTAGQARWVGPEAHDVGAEACTLADPARVLAEIEARIRAKDQAGACQAARRYGALGGPAVELFALLAGFAVSEDGALHAEKYFRTAEEEHARARPAHRATYLVALTRVMASQQGFAAPGVEEARALLG
ncbi:MAG TPA: hypothetical protein VF530_03430 [Planctomycetota bacterium]